MNKRIFIVEDNEDDFCFFQKILATKEYESNSFDPEFRDHFQKYCDNQNNTVSDINNAKAYIMGKINEFNPIDLFVLDFELEEDRISSCNSLKFLEDFILNNELLKEIPFEIVSVDVKEYHNILDDNGIDWLKKDNEWKNDNYQGTIWKNLFFKKIEKKLKKHNSLKLNQIIEKIEDYKQKNASIDSFLNFKDLGKLKKIVEVNPSLGETVFSENILEKIIGDDNDIIDIGKLKKLVECSRSVCRVTNSKREHGTGFIVEDGYLLTNNHVIPTKEIAQESKVLFNYEKDKEGKLIEPIEYYLEPETMITMEELDYTYIKIKNFDNSLSNLGNLKIETFYKIKESEKVTLIHHPNGDTKKYSTDKVISVWNHQLFYYADTEPGSSGAPILNSDLNVVGIHNQGDNEKGLKINEKGELDYCNGGILISAIMEDLNNQKKQKI
ncbi:MAG: trypsin-like peptidase domain-containing protein [Flavobacteriales bacterium]|nr:trypsin-like peptidase domain-containing protein [Flavobacteriales bacterium]